MISIGAFIDYKIGDKPYKTFSREKFFIEYDVDCGSDWPRPDR